MKISLSLAVLVSLLPFAARATDTSKLDKMSCEDLLKMKKANTAGILEKRRIEMAVEKNHCEPDTHKPLPALPKPAPKPAAPAAKPQPVKPAPAPAKPTMTPEQKKERCLMLESDLHMLDPRYPLRAQAKREGIKQEMSELGCPQVLN